MSDPNEPTRPTCPAGPADPASAILAVHEALAAFDSPGDIRRADVLVDHARTLVAASGELSALGVDERVLRYLAVAVRRLHRARRASAAHRVNWFTRPLSHLRFALSTGMAGGALTRVLVDLGVLDEPSERG